MDVQELRMIYDHYEKSEVNGTLIKENEMDPTLTKILNIMLSEHEKLEKSLINEAYLKIKQIREATEKCEDTDEFIQICNPIYMEAKGKHQGNSEKLFINIVLIGVNDILVQRFQ